MIRLIYNLLFPIGLLIFLPGYLLKMRRRGNYRRDFGQRLGIYNKGIRALLAEHSATWVHAVSVGEVAVALKLAVKLRELDPQFRCVLTTTTTTGYAVAQTSAPEWLTVLYNPLDFLPVVRRAFALIRPTRLILVEAEVWPNLVAEARQRGVPVTLVNARLSVRSERRFRRFRAFVAPTFRCLDLVCVQEADDVGRWESLGINRSRIREVGSIKFDPLETSPASQLPFEILASHQIDDSNLKLFGGSTHPGEEGVLAQTFLQLRIEFPGLSLIIAPRHVERAPAIQALLQQLGLQVALRSEPATGSKTPDCLLVDSTGELPSWYAVATVVFIGKSLTTNGGQNPVEPLVANRAVIFGPHMENFSALAKSLVSHKAAVQVRDSTELTAAVSTLLRDRAAREQLVQNAQSVLAQHRGATQRTAMLLLQLTPAGEATANNLHG